ncbi:Dicer-like protein 2 [Aspergillus nanangensis]|uniref:Dicer-like protein 2 n=1 Tax=Aspergillus nanangensis TaxID=2582783 RepID=A0AAD4CB88_ASPNN|nr:Dicer-like protein 2 [Aspergillus nanangensis]
MHELEHRHPQKLIWFLAPTIDLCIQQHEALSAFLPAARTRTLTGLDKVELWTEQAIWDAVLNEMQVIVSTHAVLSDGMAHGFVRMSQLGLIIFDEAHHCMRRHPANKIMKNHYHPTRLSYGPDAVPCILGLTASPIVRSSKEELLMIESNLNAVCKTPRAHRQDLLFHTHRPQLHQIWYTPVDFDALTSGTKTLRALVHAWETIDIEDDPYTQKLRRSPLDGKKLQELLLTRKTYCNEQLKKFVSRSCHIFEELGGWAADYFIYACIAQVKSKIHNSTLMIDWDEEEKTYLANFFLKIPELAGELTFAGAADFRLSPKLEALIDFLDTVDDPQNFSGLIFATQRATVSVLATLLAVHPRTKHRFRCAAYVGWSGGGTRKDLIGELLSIQMQRDTLSEFKSGRKNLIVATDVLEEGIDVSACRAVICYNKPPNLKSFVQRRGRARKKESTYAIILSTNDELCDLKKWQLLEKAMVEAYQDDQRKREEAMALESLTESVDDRFFVESTGAVLTADTAVAHLHHFCSILPQQPFTDNHPEISFEYDAIGRRKGTFKLPSCVHPDARRIQGTQWWETERAATKDAAFQTYKALYKLGLVNDNLLPLTRKPELRFDHSGTLASIVEVAEQYDPWVDWAYSWSSPDVHESRISVSLTRDPGYWMCMVLLGPTVLPSLDPMTCFWDKENVFDLVFESPARIPFCPPSTIERMREITELYIQAPTRQPNTSQRDYVVLFGPNLPHHDLESWLLRNQGNDPALNVYSRQSSSSTMGIVRDSTRYGEPLLFKKWIVPEQDAGDIQLECDVLPRRRNLLHRNTLATVDAGGTISNKARIIPAQACTIDKLPFSDSIFGLFTSVIVDRLEATLVATKLCETILQDVKFHSTRHVITALSAPSANGLTNYQRYEFFGDSVLKLTVSCQLFFQNPTWHEGYLSEGRDGIVKNSRLAQAALDLGLDAFVMNKLFTPRKWAAPLISKKAVEVSGKRMMSAKVLADVVEALIGAAYLDGGHEKAQTCIRRFLPEVDIQPVPQQQKPDNSRVLPDHLKKLVGYEFVNEGLLVEALTHPSCSFDLSVQSYQRLEFLGDAVLDMVIVRVLSQHTVELPQGEMTKIKHALVNANLLAFFCMDFAIAREETDVETLTGSQFKIQSDEKLVELWRFMRFEALDLTNARETVLTRHRLLRDEIIHGLHHGTHYPWEQLSQLNADKFFSDIVESVLGAIFVDSGGNLEKSAEFVEHIGLLAFLRRVLSDGVNVMHPRNIAQQVSKGETRFTSQQVKEESGRVTYRCVVQLNGVDLVVVEDCLSGEEAEVKAANATLDILAKNPTESLVAESG